MHVTQQIERLPQSRERLSKGNFVIHGSPSYLERIQLTTENGKNLLINETLAIA